VSSPNRVRHPIAICNASRVAWSHRRIPPKRRIKIVQATSSNQTSGGDIGNDVIRTIEEHGDYSEQQYGKNCPPQPGREKLFAYRLEWNIAHLFLRPRVPHSLLYLPNEDDFMYHIHCIPSTSRQLTRESLNPDLECEL
jgi:hypothetical protein